MRSITTPAGIGDGLWILSKLLHTSERFKFFIPDSSPQRGKQIYDLLPQVSVSCTYIAGLSYDKLAKQNIQNTKKHWKEINEHVFALSANSHLEAGKRIEEFLPDLPPTFKMDFATTEQDKAKAAALLPAGPKYIGIYGSAYRNARHTHYNGYGPAEWLRLIQMLYKEDKNFVFVIIGAEYDADLAEMLMKELKEQKIPYVNTIGEPLSVVMEIMRRQFYFIGFPSGLSILNEYMGLDGLMFYGVKIKGIINTWADPVRIRNGDIKECLYAEPEIIFNWLTKTYKILDR